MIMMKHTTRRSKYKIKVAITGALFKSEVIAEQRQWCENTFGKSNSKGRWKCGWIQQDPTFFFKQPKDATMFVLMWS
jgi:uncharacterized membrane protein YcjF (UPF0283 family)